jgi:hypothetical protein
MNNSFWSFARQRKYDFCRRAFYFHYISPDPELSNSLKDEIVVGHREHSSPFLYRNFTTFCLRTLFYDRTSNNLEINQMLFREGYKAGLDREEIIEAEIFSSKFKDSQFYRETGTELVHHQQTMEVESVLFGDVLIQGVAHFIWINHSGRVHIVNYQKRQSSAFQVLFALKKFGVDPDKLDIGFLSEDFQVKWIEVDWNEVQDAQEKALSFPKTECLDDFQATNDKSHCEICSYNKVCDRYSSELALYDID